MTENWTAVDSNPNPGVEGTGPRIERHPFFDGLRIVDPIEGSQFSLLTPSVVDPDACDSESFYFPVDTAASVHTSALETPYLVDIWIRDTEGNLITQSANEEVASVPPGRYNLEVSSAQMKLYLSVEGAISVEPQDDRMRISFEEVRPVTVGVRSLHEQPAATITTTDDPEDLMQAISAFGSALKTTSCERSFPTLRGHPPLLERGEELSIPAALSVPETDVRIEVPPELSYIYPVASLSYYLGATVEPGGKPRLVAGGEAFSLTADGDFESTVARVLKQVFLLDCVTRTEGYYTVDLHERELVEDKLDIDFAALYEQSLAEQVRTYLSIPYEDIEEAVPRWKLTADVVPESDHAETLPFLANDLSIIRCPSCEDIQSRSIHSPSASVEDFFGAPSDSARGGLVRSTRSYRSQDSSDDRPFDEHVFRPPPADSIEQTFVGEGIPLGASKMTVEAFYRRLNYEPSESAQTSVIVVCNEEEMNDENVVSDIYGTREWLEFDITIKENLTTEEMAEVLRTDADFLHYIGHVDEEGIRCEDGWLDTRNISDVHVDSFILNACKSYRQARGLVTNGSLGGLATITDMLNRTATKLGKTLAQLLDSGFSLAASLEVLSRESIIASHYVAVGDGNTQVVESQTGAPYRAKIESIEDRYVAQFDFYPSRNYGAGALVSPYIDGINKNSIVGNPTENFKIDGDDMFEFLDMHGFPVEYDNSVLWSQELASDFR